MKTKCCIACLSLLFFFSCKEEPVEWQLKEQVLSYYRDSVPNEDKYRAALFLLENMKPITAIIALHTNLQLRMVRLIEAQEWEILL